MVYHAFRLTWRGLPRVGSIYNVKMTGPHGSNLSVSGFEIWTEDSPVEKFDRFSLELFFRSIMNGYKINRVASPTQIRYVDIKLKSST